MISYIDHVSIAVREYDRAWNFFVNILGAIPCGYAEDNQMKYLWRIFSLGDLSRMELLKVTGKGSFLDGFLADKQGGVHHITMGTPNMAQFIRKLDENGIPYFGYREAGESYKELFIHPNDAFGVLIQVAQMDPNEWLAEEVKLKPEQRWSIEKTETGCKLTIAHPSGGKAGFQLNRDEVKNLIQELENML